jgi:hypothetical protein
MHSRLGFTLPLLLLTLCAATLHAQARLAIYGTIGAEKSGLAHQGWSEAGNFGLYYGLANFGPLAISVDGRGELSTNLDAGLFGPRLALHGRAFPIKPYVEFLVGPAFYSSHNNSDKDANAFTYRFVGGIDSTILPHLDWRVFDFSYGGGITQLSNDVHMKTITTGLVLRF